MIERLSLWAVPGGAPGRRLAALVERLAADAGVPPFRPHLTIVTVGQARDEPTAIAARLATVVSELSPQPAELVELGADGEHFRALYLRAEPHLQLTALHRAIAEAIGVAADPTYSPHLSLLYGGDDAGSCLAVGRSLRIRFPIVLSLDALELVDTSGEEVDRWRTLGRWRLGTATHGADSPAVRRDLPGQPRPS